MDRDELRKLIDDDDFGLLNVKSKPTTAASANERLITQFREVTAFVSQKGREPQANKTDVKEMMLYNRLVAIRGDAVKIAVLRDFDDLKLLGEAKKLESINDVFKDDDLGLLDAAESIFVLKHVPVTGKISPEYIAQRKQCTDFEKFKHLFKECHADLAAGYRNLGEFNEGSQITVGDFFVLKGILVYVAEIGAVQPTADGTFNARLRCIFDNGTESDLLLRSLAAALYKDQGRRVSAHVDTLTRKVHEVSSDDEQTGYIYVLRSLSSKPEIKDLKNLYKIGFSRISVEERIKNAGQEPTYLMAPVSIITAFQCYNVNPQKLELLLHRFFGRACLSIDVIDMEGRRCTPREWFIAPIEIITEAVNLLISGDIVKFQYDVEKQEIVQIARSSER